MDLTVSLGPAEVTVPHVVGFTQANAETTIAAALLVLGTVTEQPSDTVPAGTVISQAPDAGTTVANGSSVDIVVSTGVPNRAPSILSTPPTLAEVGQPYSYDVEAIDPDGDPLTYSLDTAPSGMGINAVSGQITWTPAGDQQGDHAVTVRAQDPSALFDSQSFTVAVAAASDFPVASIDTPLEDAELTGLVDIVGEASDDNLNEYVLAYAPAGSDDFAEFATGTTPVIGDTLGTLDTTLIENGLVSLRLTVTDLGGKVSTATRTVQLVGRNKPGHFSIS